MSPSRWDSYHRGGSIMSCPVGSETNYPAAIRRVWEAFFQGLPDGARVLDLGTGNGAVALIAKDAAIAASRRFDITGVDLANIDPPKFVENGSALFEGITFLGGVDSGSLPFDDKVFAAISGQYIVEYTDVATTLAEAARVLAPGGRCQLVLHHEESVIVENARQVLSQMEFATREAKIMNLFRKYQDVVAARPAKAEPIRRSLLEAAQNLQDASKDSSNPIFVHYLLQNLALILQNQSKISQGDLLRLTKKLETDIRLWRERLEDLVGCALDKGAIGNMATAASDLGFSAGVPDKLTDDADELLGWTLRLDLPGG